MFVVAGVTGNTGSVVAQTLLDRKQPVRVIVRTADKGAAWKAKGAEIAVASLDDAQALTKAFKGATGAYLLVPPNYTAASYLDDRKKVADALAQAVKDRFLGKGFVVSGGTAALDSVVERKFKKKQELIDKNVAVVKAGWEFAEKHGWDEVSKAAKKTEAAVAKA